MLSMFLEASAPTGSSGIIFTVGYIVIIFAVMYFLFIRPQKKEQRKIDEVRDNLKAGDNIMTTGGFYGVVLDVVDDTVIVEFGNNKNCRIPMHKKAIAEVEHDEETEK